MTLSLRRLPASDSSQRIGGLFVNPGGPGGSTIDVLSGWARSMPQSIRSRFDIVLFDPRGVGESSPLVCHDNIQELLGLEPYPETEEDWRGIEEAVKEQATRVRRRWRRHPAVSRYRERGAGHGPYPRGDGRSSR